MKWARSGAKVEAFKDFTGFGAKREATSWPSVLTQQPSDLHVGSENIFFVQVHYNCGRFGLVMLQKNTSDKTWLLKGLNSALILWSLEQFSHLGRGSEIPCCPSSFITKCTPLTWLSFIWMHGWHSFLGSCITATPFPLAHAQAWAHWPGHRGDVVSWEDTGGSGSQRGAFEPPVLTFLCHPVHLPFPKFKLVSFLRLVGV